MKFSVIATLASLVTTCSLGKPLHANELDKRIIGGSKVPAGKYPFAVRLNIQRGQDEYLCGGSILSNNFIVTAAHCMVDETTNRVQQPQTVSVCYGSNQVQDQLCVSAREIYVNSAYNPIKVSNDIAMIRIDPIKLDGKRAASIPVYTGKLAPKTTLTTMGWGKTSNTGNQLPESLMMVDIKVGEDSKCRILNSSYQSSNGPEVCASVALTPGKDSCQGDSGSPTVIKEDGNVYLAALTSSGVDPRNPGSIDCATPDGLAVYTHVGYFMKFITKVTKKPASDFAGKDSDHSPGEPDTTTSMAPTSNKLSLLGLIIAALLVTFI